VRGFSEHVLFREFTDAIVSAAFPLTMYSRMELMMLKSVTESAARLGEAPPQ
jgi:hypothetical protein